MAIRGVRASSALIMLIATLLGAIMLVPSIGHPVDRALDPLRFAARERAASGTVAVVEMDAASAAAIGRYPWPRDNYAGVVDALRRAGASAIVFDVDLSSASSPEEDRQLAKAFARAEGLVALPTFAQQAGGNDSRTLDSLPIKAFRDHTALASVSIAPDADGLVRSMPLATMTAATPRPSLSAYIAGRSGSVDQEFPIDLSINPSSIPRLSFAAVRDGRFDPSAVRGKTMLIGATAIEMGDRYAVPRWGVLPGVVIQALAAETLLAGTPGLGSPLVLLVLALLLGIGVLWRADTFGLAVTASGALVALVAALLIAQYGFRIDYPAASALAAISAVIFGCTVREISRRFRVQRHSDEQTGLPNRSAFIRRALEHPTTVAVLQIHNLDMISSAMGPDELRNVIIRTAERLKLASADGELYRVRGDHLAFAVSPDQPVDEIMAGLGAILRQPLEVGGRRIDVRTSIGTAFGLSPDTLLAEAALAAAEAQGGNGFWRPHRADRATLAANLSLMSDLDDAIARGHIEVHYQPKLSLAADRVTSVEALVRWRDPDQGFIGPDQFIPLAEQTGRIDALTLHVFDIVLRDLTHWRSLGHHVDAAINVSATLLTSQAFNAAIEEMLAATTVPAASLIFEVTESAAMADPEAAVAALHRYRQLGIALSMDDYGTGQSTLSYLQKLPLNELKIDRSFVQHAHVNANDGILVRSTIDLAHSLGLKVVAEGIEDAQCLDYLRNNGCDLVQGYYISRPLPLNTLLTFLEGRQAEAA